jgi:hypothetical protein
MEPVQASDSTVGDMFPMPFDFQPTLKGAMLELRPLRAEDFEVLYAVAADPLIWVQHPVKEQYQLDRFKSFFDEALKCGGTLIVRVGSRPDGRDRFLYEITAATFAQMEGSASRRRVDADE